MTAPEASPVEQPPQSTRSALGELAAALEGRTASKRRLALAVSALADALRSNRLLRAGAGRTGAKNPAN